MPDLILINEEDIVDVSTHGIERSIIRDGKRVDVPLDRVYALVKKNFDRMKSKWNKWQTFVITSKVDDLNIVGELRRTGKDWLFNVITVMYKRGFRPYPTDYHIIMRESRNIMTFESFMEASLDTQNYYDYSRHTDEDGEIAWTIFVDEENLGISDEIVLQIQYIKNPVTPSEKEAFRSFMEDICYTLGLLDINDRKQLEGFYSNFDFRKWSQLVDIGEVSMLSRKHGYDKTGYGKNIAMKLLRTRFKIIQEWVDENRPDFFISLPKKESSTDTRRLKIYDAYFRRYLSRYDVHSLDSSGDDSPMGWDRIVCVRKSMSDRILQLLENEVEEAIYR